MRWVVQDLNLCGNVEVLLMSTRSIVVMRDPSTLVTLVRFQSCAPNLCAGITQLVECFVYTEVVVGSSPAIRTSFKK
jgi:hypothetical protein